MNDTSKNSTKLNSFLNRIENSTQKLIDKDKFTSHHKHNSIDVKFDRNKINHIPQKNFQSLKEVLMIQKGNSGVLNQFMNSMEKKNTSKDMSSDSKKTSSRNKNAKSNINSLLNKNAVISNNNTNHDIEIYNTNKNTSIKNQKSNDINLRQYLFNKVNGEKSSKLNGSKHMRTASNYLINK